jgi:hypothetical protein
VHLIWTQYFSNGKVPSQTLKGSFWWREILRLLTHYKGFAHGVPRTGDTTLFWKDLWNGRILEHTFLKLFSFAVNKDVTLYTAKTLDLFQDLFNSPLSEEDFTQYCYLDIIVQSLSQNDESKKWTYLLGNGNFSAKNDIIF